MKRGPSRSSHSSSSSGGSGEYKELRLPNSRSVGALLYFCGRDPRKAKSIRRYYTDDDFDARSMGSGGSIFSRSSATSQVYLVESTDPYYYWGDSVSHSSSSRKHKSSKGRYNTAIPQNQPAGAWARRHATVEDDEEDDDSGSEFSAEDYGGPNLGGPFPPQPGMMPGGMPYPPQGPPQGPPPGAFQPVYGPGPGMPAVPQHGTPRPPPPNGFPMPPPPPPGSAMPRGGMPPPPPPPPGGHFVRGRDGIQVFEQ